MKKLTLLLLVCLSGTLACQKEPCCYSKDTQLDIAFFNKTGENLLDPATVAYFSEKDIEIYYLHNGQKTRIYNPALDVPKNILISQGDAYTMRLFPSEQITNNRSTTLIEFKGADTDTIVCELIKRENSLIVTKVFYNDSLVSSGSGTRYFEVIK